MATTIAHTFETGQAAGTTATPANSATGGDAFASVTIGTGAGVTYATSPIRGSLCLRCVTTGTASQAFVTWTSATFTPAARVYLRTTIRADTISAGMAIVRLRGSAVQSARVVINAAGRIELRDTANTTRATSSAAMTAGVSRWRVALDLAVGSSATAILYIYFSQNGTTPDETLTASAQNWGTANVDEISWGFVGAVSSSDLLLDDPVATSVALPGPAAQSAGLAEPVSFTDAVARQQSSTRALAETITVGDAVSRQLLASRPLVEALTVVDAVTRALTLPRGLAETVSTSDAVTRVLAQARGVTELLGSVDTVDRTHTTSRSLAEDIGFIDAVSADYAAVAIEPPGTLTASAVGSTLLASAPGPALAAAITSATLTATT